MIGWKQFTNKHTGEALYGQDGCCDSCHRNFTQTAFDRHRTGPFDGQRTCLDPNEVDGMHQVPNRFGTPIWRWTKPAKEQQA